MAGEEVALLSEITSIFIWGFIVVPLICAVGSLLLARSKGRNETIAFFLGLVFGIFAVIYYLICSPVKKEEEKGKEI